MYGLSILLLLAISVSSLPLSLLHHHDHKNECDIASNIPLKFKKEKDTYPKHYHEHDADCYLCFNSHLLNTCLDVNATNQYLFGIQFNYTIKNYSINAISIIELKGRAPPISSRV